MAFETADNVRGTSGLFGADTVTYYEKSVLDFLKVNTVLDGLGQKKSLPKNSGKTISFQRYTAFGASDVGSLTDGTTPSGLTLQSTEITAVPAQYGVHVECSDVLILEKIDPVIENALENIKYAAGQKKEVLTATALHGNVTAQPAGGAASEALTSAGMTAAELRKGMIYLNKQGVPTMSNGKYAAAIHPFCLHDLMAETNTGGWLDVTKYNSSEPAMNGEIGTLYGVKILSCPNIQTGTGASSAVTYRNFILGKDTFGQIDVAGMGSFKVIIKPLGAGDDPLEQRSTVGLKFWHITKVLEAARGREVFATATLS